MTQTYAQIQKQIAQLQKSADALREKELSGVVSRIKEAIAHYGLTAQQLGFSGAVPTKGGAKKTGAKAGGAKYSDGKGKFWSGMGKRPYWLRDALAAGKTLEDFRVGGPVAAGTVKTPKAKAKTAKRRPSTVLYRDGGAGNSWTGRGPQPRWLKEAIDGGKTLEELKG
jgi:DNA-binding protein H-NS